MEGCFVINSGTGLKKYEPISVSFEFFPPKTEAMEAGLWSAIRRLEPLAPEFVSVTYGAGGSTRERTHATVSRILQETALKPAAHLTCVAATKDEVNGVVQSYWDVGVRHIVALRGDPPAGAGAVYSAHPSGYQTSADLVAGIRGIADFEVSVSAYPEKHPESPAIEADLDVLEAKVDAGANRAITQFFFDNDAYWRYLERVRARRISIPIIPGLIPIHNFKQVANFAGRCGASVPAKIAARFEGLTEDPETTQLIAATVAAEQVSQLTAGGVTEFHFYTLNRANLVYAICHMLGIRAPEQPAVSVQAIA
jgi:methylenetetrahydrofolate reductase (NADPH)